MQLSKGLLNSLARHQVGKSLIAAPLLQMLKAHHDLTVSGVAFQF